MTTASRLGNLHVHDQLRGHKGQVLCVAARNSKAGGALVATGAEDSTVRLWDLRKRADTQALSWTVTSCLCRCFDGEPVASVVFSPDDGDRLFCSAGGKVMEFDLRGGRGELLVTAPNEVYENAGDEVNELATHHKGDYLAAAEDSGVVKVYNTRTRRLHKTLRNAHSSANDTLLPLVDPRDFSSGRVRSKVNLAEDTILPAISTANSSMQQVFNPPFVHSLDFAPDGRYLAAGVGDGSIIVFNAKTRAPIGRCGGHFAPVSQVHYPCFDSNILISVGNDRRLFFWDHALFEVPAPSASGDRAPPKNVMNSKVADSASGMRKLKKSSKKDRSRRANQSHSSHTRPDGSDPLLNTESTMDETPESEKSCIDSKQDPGLATRRVVDNDAGPALIEQSVPLVELPLEEKPNWICSISIPYEAVLLADTSSVVKILRWEGA